MNFPTIAPPLPLRRGSDLQTPTPEVTHHRAPAAEDGACPQSLQTSNTTRNPCNEE